MLGSALAQAWLAGGATLLIACVALRVRCRVRVSCTQHWTGYESQHQQLQQLQEAKFSDWYLTPDTLVEFTAWQVR